jgi:hypothetical protein
MAEAIHILQPIRRRRTWLSRVVVIGLGIFGTIVGGGYFWWRSEYPYGSTHACDKNLWFALFEYAETHNGNFPSGEQTPEASMSLIGAFHAHNLAGKRLSPAKTEAIMASGRLLDPTTCGWNYVEGLRKDDDYRLALFWDKEGLGHFGARPPGGGHMVMFIRADARHIPAADWAGFLQDQEKLWEKLGESGRQIRMSEAGRTPAGANR